MPPFALDVPPSLVLAKLSPPTAIVQRLQRDEGLRLKLYRDTRGNWLIGYGRNLVGRGISRNEAMMLLQNDILACQGDLDKHLPWWRDLSDLRQMVMLSLCYNLGIYGLKEFNVALKWMRAGKYGDAAREFMQSKWARQVGRKSVILQLQHAHDEDQDALALDRIIDRYRSSEARGIRAASREAIRREVDASPLARWLADPSRARSCCVARDACYAAARGQGQNTVSDCCLVFRATLPIAAFRRREHSDETGERQAGGHDDV